MRFAENDFTFHLRKQDVIKRQFLQNSLTHRYNREMTICFIKQYNRRQLKCQSKVLNSRILSILR